MLGREKELRVALPPEKFISGSQEATDFSEWQLKDWYKCILSTYPVDFDVAQGYPVQALIGDRGLIDCTVNVFAPIAQDGMTTAQLQAKHSRLLVKLKEGASPFINAQDFINGPDDRYDYIKQLFAILRKSYPGYNKKDEAHLYLAWLALACVGGDVKALADMGSFFCAHYSVVENFTNRIDFSSYGEAFRLAEATKPSTRLGEEVKSSKARERARYCFSQATHQAIIKAEDYDMNESDEFLFSRMVDVAYLVDAVAQFNEFIKDFHSSTKLSVPRLHPSVEFYWGINGELRESDGSVSYLLHDDSGFFEATKVAREKLLPRYAGEFPEDVNFTRIINDYYSYLSQSFLTQAPSLLVLRTALLVQRLMVGLHKQQAVEVDITADDLLPEYARILEAAVARDNTIKDKIFHIVKMWNLNASALTFPANCNIQDSGSGGIAGYNWTSFFSSMASVVQRYVAGQDGSGLKSLAQGLAEGLADHISDDQLFMLQCLNAYHSCLDNLDMESVLGALDSKLLKAVAQKFPADPCFFDDGRWLTKKCIWTLQRNGETGVTEITDKSKDFKEECESAWRNFSTALDVACSVKGIEIVRREKSSVTQMSAAPLSSVTYFNHNEPSVMNPMAAPSLDNP